MRYAVVLSANAKRRSFDGLRIALRGPVHRLNLDLGHGRGYRTACGLWLPRGITLTAIVAWSRSNSRCGECFA